MERAIMKEHDLITIVIFDPSGDYASLISSSDRRDPEPSHVRPGLSVENPLRSINDFVSRMTDVHEVVLSTNSAFELNAPRTEASKEA